MLQKMGKRKRDENMSVIKKKRTRTSKPYDYTIFNKEVYCRDKTKALLLDMGPVLKKGEEPGSIILSNLIWNNLKFCSLDGIPDGLERAIEKLLEVFEIRKK